MILLLKPHQYYHPHPKSQIILLLKIWQYCLYSTIQENVRQKNCMIKLTYTIIGTASTRLSNEENRDDLNLAPTKRVLFQKTVSAPPPSPNPTVKPLSLAESIQVSLTEIILNDFKGTTISPQLADELMQDSFIPVQYKALEIPPDSDETRQRFVLYEYNRRMELHIAHNTLEYMIYCITEDIPHLKSIIDGQAMFEQTWPSPQMACAAVENDQKQETAMSELLLQEAQLLIKQIQQTVKIIEAGPSI